MRHVLIVAFVVGPLLAEAALLIIVIATYVRTDVYHGRHQAVGEKHISHWCDRRLENDAAPSR